MAICGAINKYGYTGFHLYILEILSEDSSKEDILEKEDFWAKKIKPSYNILAFLWSILNLGKLGPFFRSAR